MCQSQLVNVRGQYDAARSMADYSKNRAYGVCLDHSALAVQGPRPAHSQTGAGGKDLDCDIVAQVDGDARHQIAMNRQHSLMIGIVKFPSDSLPRVGRPV